jgi:hypothetical protein
MDDLAARDTLLPAADLATRVALLSAKDLPVCQQLHFLQMACEKLSKAHLCWGGSPPADIQSSHAYSAKAIPLIAIQLLGRGLVPGETPREGLVKQIRDLAREVELLAPSVDDGGRRPDNCEYPWEDDQGKLVVPADHAFSKLGQLHRHPAAGTFLKIIKVAVQELADGVYISK